MLLLLLIGGVVLRTTWVGLEQSTLVKRALQAREIFQNSADTQKRVAEEYGFWDDTYSFIDNPSTPESKEFIRENFIEWLPRQYGEEFIVLYNSQRNPVFEWTAEDKKVPVQAIDSRLFDTLDDQKSVGGLIRSGNELFALGAARVRRTSVVSTQSNGYVVFGKKVSRAFMEPLERELQSPILLAPPNTAFEDDGNPKDSIRTDIGFLSNKSYATTVIPDLYGQPVTEITISISREMAIHMRWKVLAILAFMIALATALVIFIWKYVNKLVVAPLAHIGDELRKMQDAGRLSVIETRGPSSEWRLLISAFNGAVRDNEKREQLEIQLRQAQKMEAVGRLAGGIAHDFNNITGAMLVGASLVKMETEGVPEARSAVEMIEQSARRAAAITRQLLTFARPSSAVSGPVSINEVVRNVEKLCMRMVGLNIRMRLQLADGLPLIQGDSVQMEQAVLNLCLNARDAMPNGGEILIETDELPASRLSAAELGSPNLQSPLSGKYVVISVKDTGIGMDEDTRRHVFEPFFSTKESGKGTGLGLSTVYGIARAHNGVTTVTSAPGVGSKFNIYLPVPVTPLVPYENDAGSDESPAPGMGTILVVDDEDTLRRITRKVLEKLGYRVLEAANGVEGVRQVRERGKGIDLVLLDLVMPEMNGMDAFRQIHALQPDLPVLIASAYAHEDDLQMLMENGANGFLQKPFDIQVMANAIKSVLTGGGGGGAG